MLRICLLLHSGGSDDKHCLPRDLHVGAWLRTLQTSHWDLSHALELRRTLNFICNLPRTSRGLRTSKEAYYFRLRNASASEIVSLADN